MLMRIVVGILLIQACAPYERYKVPQQTPIQETPPESGEPTPADQSENELDPEEETVSGALQLRAGELLTVNLKIDLDVTIDGLVEIIGFDRIAPIMAREGRGGCASFSCHAGMFPADELNLSTRPFVWKNSPFVQETQIVQRMIASMRRGKMPKRPYKRLSDEDIKLFENWLANGLLDQSDFKDQNTIPKPTAQIAKITISEINESAMVVGEPRVIELRRSEVESTDFNSVFVGKLADMKQLHRYKIEITFVSNPDIELKTVVETIQIKGNEKQISFKESIPAELVLTLP